MAELLVVVIVAALALLYAADRARKLRARARQMAAMNDRLEAAAAKVDEQQERQQARVRASAELTSVLPAIRRPPLTLPGVAGLLAEQDGEASPDLQAAPDGEAGSGVKPVANAGSGVQPVAETAPAAAPAPAPGAAPAPDAAPAAGPAPVAEAAPDAGDEVPPELADPTEGTLTRPGPVIPGPMIPDAASAAQLQVTTDGTLIMPAVPGPGPASAGEAAGSPVPPRSQARQERVGRD